MVITGRTRNALALYRARGFESLRLRWKNPHKAVVLCGGFYCVIAVTSGGFSVLHISRNNAVSDLRIPGFQLIDSQGSDDLSN